MESVELEPRPLLREPPTYDTWKHDWPQYLSAYNLAFNAETYATQQPETDPSRNDNIISARVAGYFLIELFNRHTSLTTEPCDRLSIELQWEGREPGMSANDVVFRIGKLYRDYFMRLFRTTTTTRHPTPSSHPSRLSFDTIEEMTMDCMMADGTDYRTAKWKALSRDGHRCLLTGNFNKQSTKNIKEVRDMCISLRAGTCIVAVCHILSESTMRGVDPTGSSEDSRVVDKSLSPVFRRISPSPMDQTHNASTVMSLRAFGLEHLTQDLLTENGVHRLRNLLSLDSYCHVNFDNLNLWFEYTDEPNRYQVCVSDPTYEVHLRLYRHLESVGDHLFVTFTRTHESQEYPDYRLLGLHAACARVAHMSGAAEAFDEVERDLEDTTVLAVDGSDAHLLDHLLIPHAAIPAAA